MRRLFVRGALLILLSLVCSVIAVNMVAQSSLAKYRSKVRPPLVGLVVADIKIALADLSPPEMERALEDVGGRADVATRLLPADDPALPATVRARLDVGREAWYGDREGVTMYIPLEDTAMVAVLGPTKAYFDPNHFDMALAVLIVLGIVLAFTSTLIVPLVRRVQTLERAANALGDGALGTRVKVRNADAIGSLEKHFNEMSERLESLLSNQKQLVQAVAHEIRTPLARVNFGIEMMANAPDAEERQRRERDVAAELAELDELVGELLVFSRYDAGTAPLDKLPLPLRETVEDMVEHCRAGRPDIELELVGDDDGQLTVEAHPNSFNRVLRNLITNAQRYGESRVTVRLSGDDGGVAVAVEDDGPGIPEVDRERVFEPFARVDDSRNRDFGGVGLGLAIVRRIHDAHGGTVEVGQSPSGGARFVSTWP